MTASIASWAPLFSETCCCTGSGQSPLLRGKGWEVHIRPSFGSEQVRFAFPLTLCHVLTH